MNLLATMTWPQTLVCMLLIGVCCLLMIIILLQRGRGGGLAGAFGGAGGGGSAFGAKTGDVFTVLTVILATVFLLVNVVGNYMFVPETGLDGLTPPAIAAPADTSGGAAGPGGAATPPPPSGSSESVSIPTAPPAAAQGGGATGDAGQTSGSDPVDGAADGTAETETP